MDTENPEPEGTTEPTNAPAWELQEQLDALRRITPSEIVGLNRMGAGMAFVGADQNVHEIADILAALPLDWPRLSTTKRSEIAQHVAVVTGAIDAMQLMDSSHIDVNVGGTSQQTTLGSDGTSWRAFLRRSGFGSTTTCGRCVSWSLFVPSLKRRLGGSPRLYLRTS